MQKNKKKLPGFFGYVYFYPLLSVFALKCVVTLPFDMKVLQRSSDISENSSVDLTFIIHFYLRYLNVFMQISQLLFPSIICEEHIDHSYLMASKDDFFIMNSNPTESSHLAGCTFLKQTS